MLLDAALNSCAVDASGAGTLWWPAGPDAAADLSLLRQARVADWQPGCSRSASYLGATCGGLVELPQRCMFTYFGAIAVLSALRSYSPGQGRGDADASNLMEQRRKLAFAALLVPANSELRCFVFGLARTPDDADAVVDALLTRGVPREPGNSEAGLAMLAEALQSGVCAHTQALRCRTEFAAAARAAWDVLLKCGTPPDPRIPAFIADAAFWIVADAVSGGEQRRTIVSFFRYVACICFEFLSGRACYAFILPCCSEFMHPLNIHAKGRRVGYVAQVRHTPPVTLIPLTDIMCSLCPSLQILLDLGGDPGVLKALRSLAHSKLAKVKEEAYFAGNALSGCCRESTRDALLRIVVDAGAVSRGASSAAPVLTGGDPAAGSEDADGLAAVIEEDRLSRHGPHPFTSISSINLRCTETCARLVRRATHRLLSRYGGDAVVHETLMQHARTPGPPTALLSALVEACALGTGGEGAVSIGVPIGVSVDVASAVAAHAGVEPGLAERIRSALPMLASEDATPASPLP